MDLKEQLLTNTHIFKENLKVIVTNLIDIIWKKKLTSVNVKNCLKNVGKNL